MNERLVNETLTFKLLSFPEVIVEWATLRALLGMAVVHGRGELVVDDVLDLVGSDRMFVSVLREDGKTILAVAAEIIHFPRRKVLNLAFAGGVHADFVSEHFFAQLEEMALRKGADAIQCYCRPAVARLLKRLQPEAEEAYIVLEKAVKSEKAIK